MWHSLTSGKWPNDARHSGHFDGLKGDMLLWQHQKQKTCPQADATVGLYSRLIQMGHDQFSSSSIGTVAIALSLPGSEPMSGCQTTQEVYGSSLELHVQLYARKCNNLQQNFSMARWQLVIYQISTVLSQQVLLFPVLCQRGDPINSEGPPLVLGKKPMGGFRAFLALHTVCSLL